MKKINNHIQLQQSRRVVIQSIRLQLNKSESEEIHNRRRLNSLPDQPVFQIFRPKRWKKQAQTPQSKYQHHFSSQNRQYSLPLKLRRWQSLQRQELRKILSKMEKLKSSIKSQQGTLQSQSKKQRLGFGPLFFLNVLRQGKEKIERDQKKGMNLLKFKALNSFNKMKKARKTEFQEDFTLMPLKLSIELPKIHKQKQSFILKDLQKSKNTTPLCSCQKSILSKKGDERKAKKSKFSDLSPWSTKGQIFNPSEMALK